MNAVILRKGDRVRFTGAALHETSPEYYPPPGVAGVYLGGGWVQWPDGATSGDGRWHAPDSALATTASCSRKRTVKRLTAVCLQKSPKDTVKAHLEMRGENVGCIGKPTKFKDVLGRSLAVGDVVEIFNRSGVSYGDNTVCDDGCAYVMGIKASCDGHTGATGYWRLLKKRGCGEMRHGERVDGVLYVREKTGARR
jgi:hypothetical protein